MPDWRNVRDALLSAVIAYVIVTLCPKCASAQIVGAQIVSDPPVEQATTDMDTVQFPALIQQDTATATSVTTPEGQGNFTPINDYNNNLTNQLFSSINSQNFTVDFPGWVPLPAESTPLAKQITTDVLNTYGNALSIAQSESNSLGSDNLAAIESSSTGAPGVLAAIQANTDAVVAVAQGIQAERQLLATLITVEATKAAEEVNEKAQDMASEQSTFEEISDGPQ